MKLRKSIVTQLREFDETEGVYRSQKSRYEKPVWQLVLMYLPGRGQSPINTQELCERINSDGYMVSFATVTRFMFWLRNLDASIDPKNRNIGKRAYVTTKLLGEIIQFGNYARSKYTLGVTNKQIAKIVSKRDIFAYDAK